MVRRDLDRSLDVCTTAELTLRCAFRAGSVQLAIRRTDDFGSVQLTIAGVPFAARDTGYVLGHFRGFPAQPVHAWPPLRNILMPSIGSGPCIWVMVEVSCQAPPRLWSWAATCLAADFGGNHLAEAVFFFPRPRVADTVRIRAGFPLDGSMASFSFR